MRSTRSPVFLSVLTVLALQGCSVVPRETRASYEAVADITATATPMARIAPEAGEVISVLQNRAQGVLTQRIVLKGDAGTLGENAIVVRVNQGPRRMGDIDGPVPKPTEASIRAELDESFAAVDMALSQTYNRNSFGPFGYAIGHPRPNSTCIYAWQWSLGRPPRLIDSPGAVASAGSMPSVPTSVRVRLCRSKMDEAELVGFVRDLQVFPPNSADPYVDPAFDAPADPSGHDALSVAGAQARVYAKPREVASDDDDAPAPRHTRRRREADRHERRHEGRQERRQERRLERSAAREARAATQETGVLVPLPGGAPASGAAPASAAVNPLLAPLQGLATRKTAVADEMPLPGRSAPSPRAASDIRPPDAKPLIAPMPLPN